MSDVEAEILRLRERTHTLHGIVQACKLRLEALEQRMSVLEPKVNALSRKDEIAEAVAERLTSERRMVFSTFQKIGGAVAFGVLVADFVMQRF